MEGPSSTLKWPALVYGLRVFHYRASYYKILSTYKIKYIEIKVNYTVTLVVHVT